MRTLGDIVRKLGERVLSRIVPLLKDGLESENIERRKGACIGLSEIISAAGEDVDQYLEGIYALAQQCLCDESPEVREAAARVFDALIDTTGPKAIDEILTPLLAKLSTQESSTLVLDGLKQAMSVRANVVFPVLIPSLVAAPISAFNAQALGALVSVSKGAISKRMTMVLSGLMESLSQPDPEAINAVRETITILINTIEDPENMQELTTIVNDYIKRDKVEYKIAACNVFELLCLHSDVDITRYITEWFRILIALMCEEDERLIKAAWSALDALVKGIDKEKYEQYVGTIRRAMKNKFNDGEIRGFSVVPRGVAPVLAVFLQGLMNGTMEVREQAASGLGIFSA